MNPDELWNTTLNPETRSLLKVQYSKNLKKDVDLIQTLMGNDVASRKDFIIENAINVSKSRCLILMENINSSNFSLNKLTYVNLRWIACIGQLITINIVYFYFNFEFKFVLSNIIVLIGILSNFVLLYKNKSTLISEKTTFNFY